MSVYYSCILPPLDSPDCEYDNAVSVDLNYSSLFRVLFNVSGQEESREEQEKRWDVLKKQPYLLNVLVHYVSEIEKMSLYTKKDYEKRKIYREICDGRRSEFLQREFVKISEKIQDIILFYMTESEKSDGRRSCFEDVMTKIFGDNVTFYFDTVKNIYYIAVIDEKNDEYERVFKICKFLFLDIFLKTEIKWNCYPVVFDKNIFRIADEGEQRCGTII
ncbi:MAG: hypothetical protein K2I06_08545 [Ruminococcus sp.]|nr:hypothetical protein [Ruminococcus sp.]